MYAILLISVVSVFFFALYQKKTNGVCRSKFRLDGKFAIVTGGTAGMGLEIALDLVRRGAKVIIASPFPDEGKVAKNKIIAESGNGQIEYEQLDLASLKSTRQFAKRILETEPKLDILINNAGIGIPGDFITEDKLNFIMQVNYFGHYLLTLLLLPLLIKARGARVVNQTSLLHRFGSVDIEHLNSKGYWYPIQLYSNSKLCLILFSKELTRRLKNNEVLINNADPGMVGTRIFESFGSVILGKLFACVWCVIFKTPREGAQTAIHLAVDEDIKVSGEFFKDCRLSKPENKQVFDEMLSLRLWEQSKKLVQLQDNECEL